jgi:hypothetical protein
MKWAGHVLRMNDEEPTKKLMLGKPDGTRRRGRPKLRWIDGLEKISTTSVLETGKISPLTVPDGGVVLSRPRPTLSCSTNDDDDHTQNFLFPNGKSLPPLKVSPTSEIGMTVMLYWW